MVVGVFVPTVSCNTDENEFCLLASVPSVCVRTAGLLWGFAAEYSLVDAVALV